MAQKEVFFSLGEKEWIEKLQELFACTYIEAAEYVIQYKREQAVMYKQKGHHKMFCQLMDELGELTPEMEEAEVPGTSWHHKKIIMPGEEEETEQDEKPGIIIK